MRLLKSSTVLAAIVALMGVFAATSPAAPDPLETQGTSDAVPLANPPSYPETGPSEPGGVPAEPTEPPTGPNPPSIPEIPPEECAKQAFAFVDSGFAPASPGSLTRFRVRAVLGFMSAGCKTRWAQIAIFDRRAGSRHAVRASAWTKWNKKRRFAAVVRTNSYRCDTYRAAYVRVWYEGRSRVFSKPGKLVAC